MKKCRVIICLFLLILLFSPVAQTQVQAAKKAQLTCPTGKNIVLQKGKTKKLKIYEGGKRVAASRLQWSSSRKSVVTVNKKGFLTARKAGNARISVKLKQGKSNTLRFYVYVNRYRTRAVAAMGTPASKIDPNGQPEELWMTEGETERLRASVYPSNTTVKKLFYTVSDPGVAAVDGSGRITALCEGNTTVTVKTTDGSGLKRDYTVHVKAAGRRTFTIAHRGFRLQAPENTIPAFTLAGKAGAPYIECDVRQTADGELVISHDGTLERMCGLDVPIAHMTLEEIRMFDVIGGNHCALYPGTKIATLQEYIQCCNTYGSTPIIHVKTPVTDKIMDKIYDMTSYCVKTPIISSSSEKVLAYMRGKSSGLQLMWILDKLDEARLQKCKQYSWDINLKYTAVSYAAVQKVHKAGQRIGVWSLTSDKDAEKLTRWGVDFISRDF